MMATRLQKLRALAPADRGLLLEAAALIVLLRTGLRVLRFPTVEYLLHRWAYRTSTLRLPPARIAWAIHAVGARLSGTTCLVEALAAHGMLRRHGAMPTLKIGVRRGAMMALDAHAWVECEGTVVVGTTPALAEYSVLVVPYTQKMVSDTFFGV